MKNLFISHIRPIIDYCSPVWNTGYIGDLDLLESVQRRFTRQVDGFSNLPYSERLQRLNLFSIKGRLIRTDIIKMWKIFHNQTSISPNQLFTLASSSNLRGHQFKIWVRRYNTEVRRRIFSNRCVSLWNNLSPHTVQLSSLDSFKQVIGVELNPLFFSYI